MKTLIILAQSIEQPRVVKRILELSSEYDQLEIYSFNRGIHQVGNYKNIESKNVKINILGNLSNGKYLNRIGFYIKLIFLILQKFKFKSKSIYVFGLDLRMLLFFVPNAKIFYEISDIIWLYKVSILKSVLSKIDKLLTKKSKKVIFTSEGFYNKYYSFLDKSKIEIKENKFKTYNKVCPIDSIKTDKIRVAYIGSFRYFNIIRDLISIVIKNKNIDLSFYGDSSSDIKDHIVSSANKYNNIFYYGKFKNPDDLEEIYKNNNINFVVYDNKLENERVAMPNKYYESGFFNIPIITATNTHVGEMVEKMKMGWSIDSTEKGMGDFFEQITIDDVLERHQHIKTINKSFFKI